MAPNPYNVKASYPNEFNPQNHQIMQQAPLIGAGLGSGAGMGLGTLFALLTNRNPLLGIALGGGAGLLGGGMLGANLKRNYNNNMTPEEAQYLATLQNGRGY